MYHKLLKAVAKIVESPCTIKVVAKIVVVLIFWPLLLCPCVCSLQYSNNEGIHI